VAFTEDLTQFFDTDDFGVAATIGATTVNGIFENQFLGVPGEAAVAASTPTFTCQTSALPAITRGSTQATISAVTYTIVGVHPDGTGVTLLVLER
jgi:hypothetical protein